jgi:hypothetical protein
MPIAQAARRDAPVLCAGCGRSTARKSRHQRFCSPRCRNNGRGRVRKGRLGGDTRLPADPHKSGNGINGLQAPKQRPSLPINLLGGGSWRWPQKSSALDRITVEKIRRAEVAGLTELRDDEAA